MPRLAAREREINWFRIRKRDADLERELRSELDLEEEEQREHKFSVRSVVTTTTIVPNQTRFVYTGYTFVFVDAWPAGWAMGDDCYIDYVDGGYFIFDGMHPGVQVALTIVA